MSGLRVRLLSVSVVVSRFTSLLFSRSGSQTSRNSSNTSGFVTESSDDDVTKLHDVSDANDFNTLKPGNVLHAIPSAIERYVLKSLWLLPQNHHCLCRFCCTHFSCSCVSEKLKDTRATIENFKGTYIAYPTFLPPPFPFYLQSNFISLSCFSDLLREAEKKQEESEKQIAKLESQF